MELCQGDNIPVFRHAHLQVVYYNCVKFHKKFNKQFSRSCTYNLGTRPPPPFVKV
jgi:hypothetical protein